ncbi:hypothetical protein HF086_002813 [Spodoptera exigua]|uniref:GRIP domain-containing protein n=1 Tax=Spodoptera exigua TaxID=7107 RepID=A0A922M046_SPOEX|nr:hypothetical protein HF086_002813 [Spodoptera exigua]
MESLSKQELISTITKQADQIKRYEGRLRDVVAAYKGLVKEKEALEISLKALNKTESPAEGPGGDEGRDESVAALMLSLSTLTEEKSRMEEAFQADKKLTRDKYENQIAAMREETRTLIQQHLAEEQIKAKRAEESARKICARQEERVALLESKIAELSETVGQYDLRRRHDQQLIQQLKDSVNGRLMDKIAANKDFEETSEPTQKSETDNEKLADSEYLQTLIDKIHILKKELIAENDKLGSPIDISTVFTVQGYENIHLKCKEEYDTLKMEFDLYKQQMKMREVGSETDSDVGDLKNEIALLKEKVETYKMVLEEEKQDKLDTLKLYEEDVTAPPHMLHYAHELARKDLDISQLRKEKHIMEGQFRLRRIQSREGANLEYLKNVVMAYLMSTDNAGRKHMLNAIAAVLHFTTNEKKSVLSNLGWDVQV